MAAEGGIGDSLLFYPQISRFLPKIVSDCRECATVKQHCQPPHFEHLKECCETGFRRGTAVNRALRFEESLIPQRLTYS
jgi:hypothetical protein